MKTQEYRRYENANVGKYEIPSWNDLLTALPASWRHKCSLPSSFRQITIKSSITKNFLLTYFMKFLKTFPMTFMMTFLIIFLIFHVLFCQRRFFCPSHCFSFSEQPGEEGRWTIEHWWSTCQCWWNWGWKVCYNIDGHDQQFWRNLGSKVCCNILLVTTMQWITMSILMNSN